nr:hypothetical protein [Pseudaminobacter sp.]
GDSDPEATALSGASGNWVVAMSTGSGVYLQIMNSNGGPVGGQIIINPSGNQFDPVITALDDDGFVVSYTDNSSGDDQIFAQIHNSDGSVRAPAFLVGSSGANNQPAIAALPNPNWAVVYSDTGWAAGDGLTLQIFNGNGVQQGDLIRVDANFAAVEQDPDITVLANGFIVVSWTHPSGPGDNDILARIFDSNGAPIEIDGSTAPFIITASIGNDRDASISSLFDGVFGTVWTDDETDGDGDGINGEISQLARVTIGDETDNVLIGDALRDTLFGGGGGDTIVGGAGGDFLDGRAGGDTMSAARVMTAIWSTMRWTWSTKSAPAPVEPIRCFRP